MRHTFPEHSTCCFFHRTKHGSFKAQCTYTSGFELSDIFPLTKALADSATNLTEKYINSCEAINKIEAMGNSIEQFGETQFLQQIHL